MEIDKVKKLNRQRKIFNKSLLICTIVLIAILLMLIFTTSMVYISSGITLMSLFVLALASYYILPIIGAVIIILGIMYILKILDYKEVNKKIILEAVIYSILVLILIASTFYTCTKYFLTNTYEIKVNSNISEISSEVIKDNLQNKLNDENFYVKRIILETSFLNFREKIYYIDDGTNKIKEINIEDVQFSYLKEEATDLTGITQYSYRVLAIVSIVLLIIWYKKISKHYNMFIEYSIKKLDGVEGITEKSTKNNSKIIKRTMIIVSVAIIIVCIILIAIFMDKQEQSYIDDNTENILETIDEGIEENQTYYINDKQGFKIELSNLWRDRYQVTILKTEDGGETWKKIVSNLDEVYIESEFMFISMDIGFVHDPYGGVDGYDTVKITRDGGVTWSDLAINKPETIEEDNVFFRDLPTESDGILKIIAYTVNSARDQKYEYYEFESTDFGGSWNFVREVSYSEIINQEK